MATKRIKKGDVKVILECLAAGIPLEMQGSRGIRRFRNGQIIDRVERGGLQTTHRTENMMGYVWLLEPAVSELAGKAREALAHKDEILAKQAHDHRVAMGRD